MTFKIATWNVNSLRVRLPQVLAWLEENKPDVLALQETKIPDADFPIAALQQAGYHIVYSGQKAYNGVAILSRESGKDPLMDFIDFNDPQRRVLGLTVRNLRVLNLYVPNGEAITSEKYQYKLNWLARLKTFLEIELKTHSNMVILGDFNIAPEAEDVHDPVEWEGQVLCSAPERNAFQALKDLGFVDSFRLHPQAEKSYSWWDYRLNSFKRNRGLRIDHILITHGLAPHCLKCTIYKDTRAAERPSDHALVMAEFSIFDHVLF